MTRSENDATTDRHADTSLGVLVGIMRLAELQGLDPQKLVGDLAGSSELAKFCRNLLGLPEREAARRGRPADTEQNWRFFRLISLYRREGMTLDAALKEFLDRTSEDHEDGDRYDALKRKYARLLKRWRSGDPSQTTTLTSLADLFLPPPEDEQGHK